MARVAVVGGGAFGTALAAVSRRSGADVVIWALEAEAVADINTNHRNEAFLPGAHLDPAIRATDDLGEAMEGATLVLLVPPAQHLRAISARIAGELRDGVHVLICSKGLEQETGALMTEVASETLPGRPVGVLSGPTFAHELAANLPAAVTLASANPAEALTLAGLLRSPRFKPYSTDDVIGAQIGGAVKNVIAVATGMAAGLGMGENMRAALITRGLAEMVRLGAAMKADPRTFYGLSGLGDLILTCTGALSRNYSVGVKLAQGDTLEEVLKDTRTVAEGVRTSRAALGLAQSHKVDMPIVKEVCQVLFAGKLSRQSVVELMVRAARDEADPTGT